MGKTVDGLAGLIGDALEKPTEPTQPTEPIEPTSISPRTKPAKAKRVSKKAAAQRSAKPAVDEGVRNFNIPLQAERHRALRMLAVEHDTTNRAIIMALIDVASAGDNLADEITAALAERTAGKALEGKRGRKPATKTYSTN